jgi:hypothetical protein
MAESLETALRNDAVLNRPLPDLRALSSTVSELRSIVTDPPVLTATGG